VTLRKGRVKPVEFMLREGEKGLSLFARLPEPSPDDVVNAVRMAGKSGTLAVAVLNGTELRRIGLVLVGTSGGTPSAAVNAIHCEARIPLSKRLMLWLRRIKVHEYFNQTYSAKLLKTARTLE
jgi:hypothetical protein